MTTRIVSFLGLGPAHEPPFYTPVRYRWEAERPAPSSQTPLVQAALTELLPGASLYLLGTQRVQERWLGNEAALLDAHLDLPATRRHFRRVPDGRDEAARWEIFQAVQHALSPAPLTDELGEEAAPTRVVVDITHGFRIQPILGLAAVAFAQSDWVRRQPDPDALPDLQVVYGAFDARQEDEDGHPVAPIWDLTDFLTVARWNAAFDAFLRFGRADDLAALAASDAKRAQERARAAGETGPALGQAGHVGKLGERFKKLADDLATARTHAILARSAPEVLRQLDDPQTQTLLQRLPVLRSTVDALRELVTPLASDTLMTAQGLRAVSALATLYLRLQRFSEGMATIREGLVTAYGLQLASSALPEPRDGKKPKPEFDGHRKCVDEALSGASHAGKKPAAGPAPSQVGEVAKLFNQVGQARNDLQHAGYRSNYRPAQTLIQNLHRFAQRFSELAVEPPAPSEATPSLLLNLTNHPVDSWSAEQRAAALALGHGAPMDLPGRLPLVPPEAGPEEVARLAREIVDRALAHAAGEGASPGGAVVQGEYTLSFGLVAALQARGISCYAATTRREVRELPAPADAPGGAARTEHVFRFVAWRPYPALSPFHP